MNTTTFTEAAKMIEQTFPERFAQCYPRRIIPPYGYGNPRHYAADLCALTVAPLQQGAEGFYGGMHLCAQRLIELKTPTYFLHPDFFKAVAETDLDKDFSMSDLEWPAEAMVFALPLKESREYFGVEIPWIGVARIPSGRYRGPLASFETNFKDARFVIHFPVFGSSLPEDFGGMWPIDGKLMELIQSMPFVDDAYLELHGKPGHPSMTEEQNKRVNAMAMSLGVKIILAMIAEPEHIEYGTCIRKEKPNPRPCKALDALWSPNFIGRRFAEKHQIRAEVKAGAHSSPRTHFRRGHFRRIVCGVGRAMRVVKWIKATWVNL